VTAQAPRVDLTILALACEEDPGDVAYGDEIPDACQPAEGIQFYVYDVAGDREHPYASCETGTDGLCTLDVHVGKADIIQQVNALDGYVRADGFAIDPITEPAGIVVVNLSDEIPTDLPETGSGTGAGLPHAGLASLLAVTAAGFAVGGGLLRRASTRHR
jgi:hypothetical protein